MRRRAGLVAPLFAGCLLQGNPAFDDVADGEGSGDGTDSTGGPTGCDDDAFAFAVITDHPEGDSAGLARVLAEIAARPDVHFVLGAGDMPSYQSTFGAVAMAPWDGRCDTTLLPYFPAPGHAEVADGADLGWFATYLATNWADAADTSLLARLLPGVTGFRRGPTAVNRESGTEPIPDGTIYAFDYRGVHFAIVNAYEPGVVDDASAGVWDSAPDYDDIGLSQLDWLRDDLAGTASPLRFVVGHVPLAFICYADPVACPDIPAPPGVSEHNGPFHTEELTAALVESGVAAYFHGHDEIAARLLVDSTRAIAYRRAYWEVVDDPAPDPSSWEPLQGPGRIWQVDAGRVDDGSGFYVIVHVDAARVRYEIHAYADGLNDGATVLWDAWEQPR